MSGKSVRALLLQGGTGYGLVLLAQLLSAGAGLIFVNFLTTDEFALFTVCTALLQAVVAQSDLGTLAAIGYFFRERTTWSCFAKVTIPAISSLRLKFFLLSGIALTLFFIYSGAAEGATATQTTVLLCITLGTAWFGMVNAFQITALRVRGDVNTSIGIETAAGFVRFALAVSLIGFQLLSTKTALVTSLLSAILSFLIGHRYIPEIPLGVPRQRSKQEQYKAFRYVLPLIPGSIYYTLQPSILIWLSAMSGSTQRVAEVGAIARIGQIVTFVALGLNLFVLPHLAALRDERDFRRSYVVIWFIVCCVGCIVFLAVAFWRDTILLLLGPNYSNLGNEVMLVAGASLLQVAANYAVIVNRLRGWNKLEPLSTIVLFVGQALLIILLPLNSTASILILGLLYAVLSVLVTFSINIIGFVKPAWAIVQASR